MIVTTEHVGAQFYFKCDAARILPRTTFDICLSAYDGRQHNAAVFQTNITGADVFQFIPSVGLQTTVSIDKIKSKGFDLDFSALLPGGATIFGGYGYTDAAVEAFAANPADNGNVAPGTFKYTINLGVTQTFSISDTKTLTPRIELNRQGPIWWDVNNTPGTKRDALNLLRARLSLSGGKQWEISAYGDNLLNKQYFQEVVPILSNFTVNYRGWTRTFGIEGSMKF
ncbi:MAG: TonB-dependent receptor [Proteobacteria bacterium]|nr:TonB-dependent receptor [Pseudomonadota bacterium]